MKLKKHLPEVGKRETKNLPLLVTGFHEINDEVAVQGKDLSNNGEEALVFLTQRGKAAENSNRISLRELQDGFTVHRHHYKLEKGGIVHFRGCFPSKADKTFLASWPNVLAYNAKDAKAYVGNYMNAFLDIGFNTTTGQHFGNLYVFEANPKNYLIGASVEKVQQLVEGCHETRNRPSYLIRYTNGAGLIFDYDFVISTYNRHAGRPFTPEEMSIHVAQAVDQKLAELHAKGKGTAQVNIVPVSKIQVSPKTLNSRDNNESTSLSFFHGTARAFIKDLDSGQIEHVAKEVWVKLGGEQKKFINAVYVNDPYGEGIDPVCLGGLRYPNSEAFATQDHEGSMLGNNSGEAADHGETLRGAPDLADPKYNLSHFGGQEYISIEDDQVTAPGM